MARRGYGQRREPLAIVSALALHGAMGVALWQLAASQDTPSGMPAMQRAPARTEVEVEVEIDLGASAQAARKGEAAEAPPADLRERVGAVARLGASRSTSSPAPGHPPDHTSDEGIILESTPPVADASDEEPRQGPIDLGLGPDAWQRWVGVVPRSPAAPAPKADRRPLFRAPPVSSTGGLQEGLEARDLALGIGPAGRVRSALYDAAHHTDAPELGKALFDVTVLRTGAVEITLNAASDEKWAAVAKHAAHDLRRSPPRIPPPREGYRITIAITAEEVSASGVKRKDLHGPRVEAVAPRLRDVEEERKEIELKNPTAGVGHGREDVTGQPIIFEPPGVFLAGTGKICSYRIGITPGGLHLGGGCDPTGAKFQRLVRTEVREQVAF